MRIRKITVQICDNFWVTQYNHYMVLTYQAEYIIEKHRWYWIAMLDALCSNGRTDIDSTLESSAGGKEDRYMDGVLYR